MIRHRVNPIGTHRRPIGSRRGFTLLEVGVALTLLGTVLALLVPVLSRTSGLRDQLDRRELALGTVANLLERASLVTTPTAELLQPIAAQLTDEGSLPSPEWKIVVTPEQSPPMQRVEATLSWQAHSQSRNSITLVQWYSGGKP